MKWEELTSSDIEKIDKDNTVVILPVGSIEVHGPHLPLGTDTMVIYHVALKAAELENALVLPPIYYAYVPENRHFPGTISLNSDTILMMLEDIITELSRQGFKKILILNGHGGNKRILKLLARRLLEKGCRAQVYLIPDTLAPVRKIIEEVKETKVYEHACEIETSLVLHLAPHLVKLERVKGEAKVGKRRIVDYLETLVDWQRYAIMGYVGNPLKATREKGRRILEAWIHEIASTIKAIKEDTEYEKILGEFYEKSSGEDP
ncbi:MAG: creatininase family protein [Thermoproteales archaeon]|nr:creatininase family protein [Thermoproteales archaeon]